MYELCVYAYIKHKWFFPHWNVLSSSCCWSGLLLLLKLYRSICIALCFIVEIYWTNVKKKNGNYWRFWNVKVVCCCFIQQFYLKNVITYFIALLKIAEHGCLGCYASFAYRNHVAEHSYFNDYFWNVCLSLNFNGSIYIFVKCFQSRALFRLWGYYFILYLFLLLSWKTSFIFQVHVTW